MTARQDAKEKSTTNEWASLLNDVDTIGKVTMITKAPWYKEAAGVVAVFSWLSIIGLYIYAVATDTFLRQWWYVLAIFTIAIYASALRNSTPKFGIDIKDIS